MCYFFRAVYLLTAFVCPLASCLVSHTSVAVGGTVRRDSAFSDPQGSYYYTDYDHTQHQSILSELLPQATHHDKTIESKIKKLIQELLKETEQSQFLHLDLTSNESVLAGLKKILKPPKPAYRIVFALEGQDLTQENLKAAWAIGVYSPKGQIATVAMLTITDKADNVLTAAFAERLRDLIITSLKDATQAQRPPPFETIQDWTSRLPWPAWSNYNFIAQGPSDSPCLSYKADPGLAVPGQPRFSDSHSNSRHAALPTGNSLANPVAASPPPLSGSLSQEDDKSCHYNIGQLDGLNNHAVYMSQQNHTAGEPASTSPARAGSPLRRATLYALLGAGCICASYALPRFLPRRDLLQTRGFQRGVIIAGAASSAIAVYSYAQSRATTE